MSVANPSTMSAAQRQRWERANFGGPQVLVGVRTNAPELADAMARLAREQLPFATAVALTRVAYEARDELRGRMGQTFTLRNKRVQQGIQVNRAEKRDWPRSFAEVGTKDKFMALHVTGGAKRPERGAQHIAIPTKIVRRGSGGAVRTGDKPFSIRERPTGFVGQRGRNLWIRERVTGKKERSRVGGTSVTRASRLSNLGFATFYLLKQRVQIAAAWPFVSQVEGIVGRRYGHHFRLEYEAAMKSARAQFDRFSTEQGRFFYLKARRALL